MQGMNSTAPGCKQGNYHTVWQWPTAAAVDHCPGLRRFGEQDDVDRLIRKYRYSGPNGSFVSETEPILQDLTHGLPT